MATRFLFLNVQPPFLEATELKLKLKHRLSYQHRATSKLRLTEVKNGQSKKKFDFKSWFKFVTRLRSGDFRRHQSRVAAAVDLVRREGDPQAELLVSLDNEKTWTNEKGHQVTLGPRNQVPKFAFWVGKLQVQNLVPARAFTAESPLNSTTLPLMICVHNFS